jgi:hypothetical protein
MRLIERLSVSGRSSHVLASRIAITAEAYDAIARTLALGTVTY